MGRAVHQAVTQAKRHLNHDVPAATKKLLLRPVPLHPHVEESWSRLLEMPASNAKRHGLRLVHRALPFATAEGPHTRHYRLNPQADALQCDGKQPCSRCEARVETSECIYKIHIKHAKEELVKQIEQLRAKEHVTERILQALSANEKVSEILERLQSGETYDSIVELLAQSPVVEFEIPSPKEFRYSTHEPPHHEMGGDGASKRFWTIVTSDTAILDLQSGSSSKQDPSPA